MTLCRQWLMCCLLVAVPLTANAADSEADSARDLILLSAERPVVVRFLLQVDGAGIRQRWREYADRVFATIDADRNQQLDVAEIDNVPVLITSARQASDQRTLWSQLDVDPADGKVDSAEFRRFVSNTFDRSLSIRPFSSSRTQAVALFPRLDADRDGQLSPSEISHGYETLRSDDIDANDVIGIDELLPPQDPNTQAQAEVRSTADAELDVPFLELRNDPATTKLAAETILKRYGRSTGAESQAPPNGLTAAQLALAPADMAKYDSNRDQWLDVDELSQMLRNPQPRVRILVALKVRSFGRPKINLLADEDGLANNVNQLASSRLQLSLAGIGMTLSATRPRTTISDASNFFKLRFRVADADKNQYVDANEFGTLSLPSATFETIDKDGDGKIFRKELNAYVDDANGSADVQLLATISKQGKSLFEMLDENSDLRLTRREFQDGPGRLSEIDQDGNGQFAAGEFQHRYYFSFRSGESPLLPPEPPAMAANNQTTPIVRDETSGPLWFQRMDRNRDGDVSQREFLGSPEAFRQLDADGDGLLTAIEAGTTSNDESETGKPME